MDFHRQLFLAHLQGFAGDFFVGSRGMILLVNRSDICDLFYKHSAAYFLCDSRRSTAMARQVCLSIC